MSPHVSGSPEDLPDALREQVAERLLAAPLHDRAGVIDELERDHPAHARQLRRLAEDLAGAESLLEHGFGQRFDPALAASGPDPFTDAPDRTLGPYRVLRMIGEGGFGVVYLCAQDAPVRRDVAVKLLRPGAGDRHTLARFEAERHVLATLQHPAIAQVFDAGALPDGRPYFVMEYVRGLPITEFCDRAALSIDARLRLFETVCTGVHHAHVQGVLHRDLKPANVLAYEQDGRPWPKIIDFGIAKALLATGVAAATRTEAGHVVGTPGYMSPEQAAGSGTVLDARADVFSLGVLLYELLTGERPYDRWPGSTDFEPLRPSVRVRGATASEVASRRALAPRRLEARLRGDLDWIVLKALARERERRYASASELADDLERHRAGRPVLAGPPALRYRLRKFVRRHRSGVIATGVAVLAVASGAWASLTFRAEAARRTDDLQTAATNLLARARAQDVAEAPPASAARMALAKDALALYTSLLRDRPTALELREGRARALWTVSQVHWALGDFRQSEVVARESLAAAEQLAAEAPDNLVYRGILGNALRNLGRALASTGQDTAARPLFERAVGELEACHARDEDRYAALLVRAMLELASTQEQVASRRTILERAVALQETAVRRQPSAETHLDLVDVHCAFAQIATMAGDLAAAAASFARADELLAATPEAPPAYTCKVQQAAGELAMRRGEVALALACARKALAAAERWVEQEPKRQAATQAATGLCGELAERQLATGDPRSAAETFRAAVRASEAETARFAEDVLARGRLGYHLSGLARALLQCGRRDVLDAAETSARRAVAVLDAVPASVDPRSRATGRAEFAQILARVLTARGSDQAEAQWRAADAALQAWVKEFGIGAADADVFVGAGLRSAEHGLAAEWHGPTAATLAQIEVALHDHASAISNAAVLRAQWRGLRARLAARRGQIDLAVSEAAAMEHVAVGPDAALAAALSMYVAWRATEKGDDGASSQRATCRERAVALHETLLAALRDGGIEQTDDSNAQVVFGQTALRLAELRAEQGEPKEVRRLLAGAVPLLEAHRDSVHANLWDEDSYQRGLALRER
jgi:serine/threonine protein kinase